MLVDGKSTKDPGGVMVCVWTGGENTDVFIHTHRFSWKIAALHYNQITPLESTPNPLILLISL